MARVGEGKAKAFVLLNEHSFIGEHIGGPGRYFHTLITKGVLDEDQCSDIRGQQSVEYQVRKFLELISLNERGYDVFLEDLVRQKVSAHVASYLKKNVRKITGKTEGQFSSDQLKLLTQIDFIGRSHLNHELAMDILSGCDWNLKDALNKAALLGLCSDIDYSDDSSDPLPQGHTPMDSGGFFDVPCHPVPAESTSCESLQDSYVEDPMYGLLPPPLPPQTLQLGPERFGDDDMDVHPDFGILPSRLPAACLPFSPTPLHAVNCTPLPQSASSSQCHVTGQPTRHDSETQTTPLPQCHVTGQSTRHDSETQTTPLPANSKISHRTQSPATKCNNVRVADPKIVPRNIQTPQTDGNRIQDLGSFWTCYHCNWYNTISQLACERCEMFLSYTEGSWDNNQESRMIENYECQSCKMFARLPYLPCPQKLAEQLGRLKLCYKCYRNRKLSPPSAKVTKATQTGESENNNSPDRPSMLLLQSTFEQNGRELRIMYEIAPRWELVATALDIDQIDIDIISRNHQSSVVNASRAMLSIWIDRKAQVSWEVLIDALYQAGYDYLAHRTKLRRK